MDKLRKKIKGIAWLMGLFLLGTVTNDCWGAEFNYSVSPEVPENQLAENSSYFDLLLQPNQAQQLTIWLRNDTDQSVTIEADVHSASTNDNGVVEYSKPDRPPDSSLRYKLEEWVEAAQEVTLAPHTKKAYPLTIRMPNERFNGVIAGGITFSEKNQEMKKNDQQGLAILNKFSYSVALLMRQHTENGGPVLKLVRAQADQVNQRTVIQGTLRNPAAVYLNQLVCQATITKQGQRVHQATQSDLQMAPNSYFNLTLFLNSESKQRLAPGQYQLAIEAYGQQDPNGSFKDKKTGTKYRYHWIFTGRL